MLGAAPQRPQRGDLGPRPGPGRSRPPLRRGASQVAASPDRASRPPARPAPRSERARANELEKRGDGRLRGPGAALSAALTASPSNPWSRYELFPFPGRAGAGRRGAIPGGSALPVQQIPEAPAGRGAVPQESQGRSNDEGCRLAAPRSTEASRNRAVRDLAESRASRP
ncbi:hypothetical protein ACRAWD_17575 [Caulobacter segnis]